MLFSARACSLRLLSTAITASDVRFRPPGEKGNDINGARYRYTEPGWIATTLSKGIERMRGPRGDWYVQDGAATKLQGADFANDSRELDESVQTASNFVRLIDPHALRIRSLVVMSAPPVVLPAAQIELAKTLTWLDIVSPDVTRPGAKASETARPIHSQVGLDPKTHLPRLAVATDDDKGVQVPEIALLVQYDNWGPLDGFQVPSLMLTYPLDRSHSPWTFGDQYNVKLGLIDGTLRPKLTEQDFLPPQK